MKKPAEWRKYETDDDRRKIAALVEERELAQARITLERRRIKDRCIKQLIRDKEREPK